VIFPAPVYSVCVCSVCVCSVFSVCSVCVRVCVREEIVRLHKIRIEKGREGERETERDEERDRA